MSNEQIQAPTIRVLLALAHSGLPNSSLRYAATLTRALGGELHVLRVIPRIMRTNPPRSMRDTAVAVKTIERMVQISRSMRPWLLAELGESQLVSRFVLRDGAFIAQVAERARSLDAKLIVVPAEEAASPAKVAALARACAARVLVARGLPLDPALVEALARPASCSGFNAGASPARARN
ncbi:MAG TPA: universal stress protein [Polyangiaceae bacterium]|jgi:hypothetical protein